MMIIEKLHNNNFVTFILTVLLIGVCSLSIQAQKSKIVEGGIINGVPYASTDFENINLTNGNLNLSIPLASLQGRGTSGFGYSLHYNSKLLQVMQSPVYGQNGQITYQDFLEDSYEGGWHDLGNYQLEVWNRNSGMDAPTGNVCQGGVSWRLAYRWKVEVKAPDGTKIEFRPTGYSDIPPGGTSSDGGYFNVHPNGSVSSVIYSSASNCSSVSSPPTNQPMTYYSSDGSGMRLTIQAQGEAGFTWEISMPDGSKVVQMSDRQRILDRNGNYVESAAITLPDGSQAPGWMDQLGRYIARKKNSAPQEDTYYQLGNNGVLLTWKVKWKTVYVLKEYTTTCNSCGRERGPVINTTFSMQNTVVERIELPTQLGGQVYTFKYYAKDVDDETISQGWGEVKSVTIPTGAKINYGFKLSNFDPALEYNELLPGEIRLRTDQILERAGTIRNKKLAYTEHYDGISQLREESWGYATSRTGSSVVAPDGSYSYQSFWDNVNNIQRGGQVYKEVNSNGTITERIWANNYPGGITYGSGARLNAYVKTEFTTISDAAGNPSLTTIKDFNYDKNGNLLSVTEYDWVSYASIARNGDGTVIGIPAGAVAKRNTSTNYYNSTPIASDTTTNSANAYWNASAPIVRNAVSRTEIANASVTEIVYDNPATTANPTEVRTWDSTKGGISNPLTPNNSISTTAQYDVYGNVTLTTDAKGNQTQITYGDIITPTGTVNGLYPTQTISAYGTPIAQTVKMSYDFYTGLPKTVTALGNTAAENVINETEYDALGRPTKSKAAVGTPLEIWTTTEYDDVLRRVISRSDIETKGDGKKIAVQHYDQLGRVRLTRQIENVATEDPTNEQHGIKVQTRYQTGNPYSYQLSSNPYRAATSNQATAEESMGWTRSKSINTGKHAETETFTGAILPAPWGDSSSSTGMVRSDIDGDRTLVTDQAGKRRISKTNALGQLINIWEVKEADTDTEAISFGALSLSGLKTSYQYDTLNNLTTVNQGVQTRSFSYSSLSRLLNATNPESGIINYNYDDNGNLTSKTDARNITTSYVYDALNRVKTRSYTGETGYATPNVAYFYDNLPNAKGKLTKVVTGNLATPFSVTEYQQFDITGRVEKSRQTTDGTVYNPMEYLYNLSGAMIEQKYPSGRIVKNTLNNDGDLSQVQSQKANGTLQNYANSFNYTAAGAVSSMRLGNGKWENTQFNSRLQPIQIGLGSSATSQNLLKLDFDYGTTDNNGNVLSQTITVPTIGAINGFTAIQTYTYDSLNRIKDAKELIGTNQQWKQTFLYDRYGNRRFDEANTTTLQPNCQVAVCNPQIDPTNNKLIGYGFDEAGNTEKDAQNRKFTYDAENKQTKVETIDGSGNPIATVGLYFYDGDGKRVKKISATETTIFIYDASGKMVAEYSTAVASQQDAKVSYLTNDHLGSPRITTNANGQVISRRDFQPFGEEIARANYGTDSVRQKFTAYERDTETELDFAEARYYNSKHGRFTTTDPIFFDMDRIIDPQQLNIYLYVVNNPLKYIDPTGLDIEINGDERQWAFDEFSKGLSFKTTLSDKNKVVILDKDGKQLDNEKDKKALNKMLKGMKDGPEKELFKAIIDTKNHGVLTANTRDDDVDIGETKGVGKNSVDRAEVEMLGKHEKDGGFSASDVVRHEAMEAYLSAKSGKPVYVPGGVPGKDYDSDSHFKNPFPGLRSTDERRSGNTAFLDAMILPGSKAKGSYTIKKEVNRGESKKGKITAVLYFPF